MRDWEYITHRNAAATVDLRAIDGVQCIALHNDLHVTLAVRGVRLSLRLADDAAVTLLDDLTSAGLLQAHQRDALRRALTEPTPEADATED